MEFPKSAAILAENRRFIPGGVVSVNRAIQPEIVFSRGQGAYVWDVDGNRYIDYHAAFAPHLLGHNDPHVNAAVIESLQRGDSLYGSGATEAEGRLAAMICQAVPSVDSVQMLNSGSEATYQAIRIARAATRRDHIIVMQGGYNGWHNDVSCNLMTPLETLGPRLSPGEYPYVPMSAGVPESHQALVHVVNFNDLDSVDWVCRRYPVAALIAEPVLQNIGVVKPRPGYLQGLRRLAEEHGFLLIFDEVKTGFRHALGGYSSLCGVQAGLTVFGKAIANGYPMAVIGGKREFMDYVVHPDPQRRVLLAGTYNAHPVGVSAAIATIERLTENGGQVYRHIETLGEHIESGLAAILRRASIPAAVVRQGSAFCVYFMDHEPVDWHDLAANHDFSLDLAVRRRMIENGVYTFPLAVKQWSLSFAHTLEDVEKTLEVFREALAHALECAHQPT
jgi:glutamate-1-semialdehyde 2,1-aminomutase